MLWGKGDEGPKREPLPPSPTPLSIFTWAGQRTPASSNEDPWPHFHFWSRIRDSGAQNRACVFWSGERDRMTWLSALAEPGQLWGLKIGFWEVWSGVLQCLRCCSPAYWRVLQVPIGYNGCRALPLLFAYNEQICRREESLRKESAHKQFSPVSNSAYS